VFKPLPEQPNKDRVIELVSKNHTDDIPNWTTAEQIEVLAVLRAISFYWYRDESLLEG